MDATYDMLKLLICSGHADAMTKPGPCTLDHDANTLLPLIGC